MSMEEKRRYIITLHGCDDSTKIEMDITDAEHEFLQRMSDHVLDASKYGCMPTMSVVPVATKTD